MLKETFTERQKLVAMMAAQIYSTSIVMVINNSPKGVGGIEDRDLMVQSVLSAEELLDYVCEEE